MAKLLHIIYGVLKQGSEQAQKDLVAIKVRASLVSQRSAVVKTLGGVVKSMGLRIASSSSEGFHVRVKKFLAMQPELEPAIAPAVKAHESLTERIWIYEMIDEAARTHHPEALKLQKISSIGLITSLAFVLSNEDSGRFKEARDVGAYVGLVPRREQLARTCQAL